jgi:hypothetical protein
MIQEGGMCSLSHRMGEGQGEGFVDDTFSRNSRFVRQPSRGAPRRFLP